MGQSSYAEAKTLHPILSLMATAIACNSIASKLQTRQFQDLRC